MASGSAGVPEYEKVQQLKLLQELQEAKVQLAEVISASPVPAVASTQALPAPERAPTDHELLLELVKRYEVLGTAVVKLSEKVGDPATAGPQSRPTTGGMGDQIKGLTDLLNAAKGALGMDQASPMANMNALYQEVGQKVVGATIDSAVRNVVKTLGSETARHVTGGA